jgi:type II secretory pathway pseudopilin PulG
MGNPRPIRSPGAAKAGVSLIELLVTTVVLLGVLLLIALPLSIGFSYLERMLARVDAQRAARRATEAITRELAEAMYVFDIAPGGSELAFVVPQSGAAPPSPAGVVRYWAALRDPSQTYKPYYQLVAPGRFADPPYHPHFLARTQVEDPWKRDDAWNDTDPIWGLVRATYFYPAGYVYPPSGATWPDSQPGYPWLQAVQLYPGGGDGRTTYYRENAIAITPSDPGYDLAELEFAPQRVSNETLAPRSNYSLYSARYPNWSGFAAPRWDTSSSAWVWDEVGVIEIYRANTLVYQTKVRASDGSVWVCGVTDPGDDPGEPGAYNTRLYPLRAGQPYAFGLDYDAGAVNFAFPAADTIAASGVSSYPLPTASALADAAVLDGSDSVSVNGTVYRRVEGLPGTNEYHIEGATLEFSPTNPPVGTIAASYQYRNNRAADLAVASYSTKKLVNVALSVSKEDRTARNTKNARQDFRVVARVEVRNTPD